MSPSFESLVTYKRQSLGGNQNRNINLAIGSDRGRIIFSAPFRRLQKKAQVFPLETNGSIRSRLTHSLEVAHIGMYIVEKILEIVRKKKADSTFDHLIEHQLAFATLVENACLMHDLGNPPFGHFGEKAIQDWFTDNKDMFIDGIFGTKSASCLEFESKEYQDFLHFDGNPQGIRIVSKLQGNDGKSGLHLTYSQLASYLKYTRPPNALNATSAFQKKPGFFLSEEPLVREMWEQLHMTEYTRHPLVYIMEAADDLAYCMSDVEDGIEKNIVTWDHFKKEMTRIWRKNKEEATNPYYLKEIFDYATNKDRKKRIPELISFKTKLNNILVDFAANRFVKDVEVMVSGTANSIFHKGDDAYLLLETLKLYTREFLFRSDEAENIELAGYAIIKGILNHLMPLLTCSREEFSGLTKRKSFDKGVKETDLYRRLFRRLPRAHVLAYKAATKNSKNDPEEWYYRAHLIIDFVAGMTDQFALEEYQLLSGIKVL